VFELKNINSEFPFQDQTTRLIIIVLFNWIHLSFIVIGKLLLFIIMIILTNIIEYFVLVFRDFFNYPFR